VHVPAPTNETLEPDTVQTPALPEEGANETGRPELAVAETGYEPPTTAGTGGLDVNVIDWTLAAGAPTPKDCCVAGVESGHMAALI